MPIFYLDDVVSFFFTGTYDVTRSNPSTFPNGVEVVDPSPTTVQVQALIESPTPVDLKRLPEGRRTEDMQVAFTLAPLYGASDTHAADVVNIDGDLYEVQGAQSYAKLGDYYRSVLLRVGRLNA